MLSWGRSVLLWASPLCAPEQLPFPLRATLPPPAQSRMSSRRLRGAGLGAPGPNRHHSYTCVLGKPPPRPGPQFLWILPGDSDDCPAQPTLESAAGGPSGGCEAPSPPRDEGQKSQGQAAGTRWKRWGEGLRKTGPGTGKGRGNQRRQQHQPGSHRGGGRAGQVRAVARVGRSGDRSKNKASHK